MNNFNEVMNELEHMFGSIVENNGLKLDYHCDEIYQNYYSICEEDCKTFREIRQKVGDDRCSEIDGCYENHMNILNELNSKHQATMYHYVLKLIKGKFYHEDTDSDSDE